MEKEILVSIIIPAYNSEKHLSSCLESVLKQDFKNFEVIIVDNNSTDKTKEIILEFARKHKNLKYVFEPKIGRGSARNTGINNAEGEIIAMTDSDCIVSPSWLKEIIKPIIKSEENIVMGIDENVFTNYWSQNILEEQENFFKSHVDENYIDFLDTKNFAINSKLMKEYMFDENLKSLEDFDLAFRIKKHHKIRLLKEVKVKHFHKDNFVSWLRLQTERGFWSFKIYNKYKNVDNGIKKENMMASINLINTIIFPIWLLKQLFTQPIKRFPFILTSEVAWRMGLLGSLVEKLFNKIK